jgi:hypothetical protein
MYLKFLYITKCIVNILWTITIELCTQLIITLLVFLQINCGLVEAVSLCSIYSINLSIHSKLVSTFCYKEHKGIVIYS